MGKKSQLTPKFKSSFGKNWDAAATKITPSHVEDIENEEEKEEEIMNVDQLDHMEVEKDFIIKLNKIFIVVIITEILCCF